MKECLVVNQEVGASNPLARPLLSRSANLSYMTSSCEYGSLCCSPRSPNRTAFAQPLIGAEPCAPPVVYRQREFVGQSPSCRRSTSWVTSSETAATQKTSRNVTLPQSNSDCPATEIVVLQCCNGVKDRSEGTRSPLSATVVWGVARFLWAIRRHLLCATNGITSVHDCNYWQFA